MDSDNRIIGLLKLGGLDTRDRDAVEVEIEGRFVVGGGLRLASHLGILVSIALIVYSLYTGLSSTKYIISGAMIVLSVGVNLYARQIVRSGAARVGAIKFCMQSAELTQLHFSKVDFDSSHKKEFVSALKGTIAMMLASNLGIGIPSAAEITKLYYLGTDKYTKIDPMKIGGKWASYFDSKLDSMLFEFGQLMFKITSET